MTITKGARSVILAVAWAGAASAQGLSAILGISIVSTMRHIAEACEVGLIDICLVVNSKNVYVLSKKARKLMKKRDAVLPRPRKE